MPKLHVRCTEQIESFAHVSTRRGRTRNGRHRPGGRGLEAEGSVSSATTVRRGLGAVMTTLGAGCRETCSSSSTGACWASKPCFEVQIPTFDPMAVAWPTLKKGDREVPRRHVRRGRDGSKRVRERESRKSRAGGPGPRGSFNLPGVGSLRPGDRRTGSFAATRRVAERRPFG